MPGRCPRPLRSRSSTWLDLPKMVPGAPLLECAGGTGDLWRPGRTGSIHRFVPRKCDHRLPTQKKPAWRNTLMRSATPVYSSTSPPAKPACPLSSRPTKFAYVLVRFACSRRRATQLSFSDSERELQGNCPISHQTPTSNGDYLVSSVSIEIARMHALVAAAYQDSRRTSSRCDFFVGQIPRGDPGSIFPAQKKKKLAFMSAHRLT